MSVFRGATISYLKYAVFNKKLRHPKKQKKESPEKYNPYTRKKTIEAYRCPELYLIRLENSIFSI